MTDIAGFTPDIVCQLTGLSRRQLSYWDRTGFFSPRYSSAYPTRTDRMYDFRDVVGLRTIATLRNTHRVSLQELREVGGWLRERYAAPWAALSFSVAGRHVYFDAPCEYEPSEEARFASLPSGQTVLKFELEPIASEVRDAANRLRQRQPRMIGRIEQRRNVAESKPILAGTRIPTSAVWRFHQAGFGTDEIIREYPRLTAEDISAAIAYEQRTHERAG